MKYNPPIGGAANDPYIDGNPGTGTAGSAVPAAAVEHAQREIVNVIAQAGLTPTDADLTQLHAAIVSIVAGGTSIVFGTTTNAGSDFSMAGSIASYGTANSRIYIVNFNAAGGASPTLNINALGPKAIKDTQGNTLAANRLPAGPRLMIYDGTDFRAYGLANPVLHVREEQAAGTNGGSFNSGSWQTRTLNTVVLNEITGASLSSNQFVLPAGVYRIKARAPAQSVNRNRARIYNVTDAAQVIFGETADITQASNMYAEINGTFVLTAQKTLRLEHSCQTSNATTGFGAGGALGINEVYSEVRIEKVG